MIKGTEGLSEAEIAAEIGRGGRFVIYLYTVSVGIMTFRRSSGVYFLKAGQSGWPRALPWTLLTLVAGWWGIPWGPVYSVQSLYTNLTGGRDVTARFGRAAA